jgi:hypothetical protein
VHNWKGVLWMGDCDGQLPLANGRSGITSSTHPMFSCRLVPLNDGLFYQRGKRGTEFHLVAIGAQGKRKSMLAGICD